jgi:Peptidase family C25
MDMRVEKLIVTHDGLLKAKYGRELAKVRAALKALVASDKVRGLSSKVISLDSAAAMKRAGGAPVSNSGGERATKVAIDALCRHYDPDYLLIVGAQDVIPHISLQNPMNARRGTADDDDTVPSDLPYACEASFSRDPSRFLGPTRVVGRLPDMPGANDPAYLVRLLEIAAKHVSRPRAEYANCFALSARVWVDSTELSATNLFGLGAKVRTSPKEGPNWTTAQLAPRIHFINCHGNTLSPKFSGEGPPDTYFEAHHSPRLHGRVTEGSVIAAECCYGAELYDPEEAGDEAGICMTYLSEGAYGFFGSTTIAYGPAEGNGQADLICQYFLDSVLKGASLGRGALEARQRFIAQYSHQDPSDLKTLAQFILLGDPSVHPVQAPMHSFQRAKTFAKSKSSGLIHMSARTFRRERIVRTGINLGRSVGAAVPALSRPSKAVRELLLKAAKESGIATPRIESWKIRFPHSALGTLSPSAQSALSKRSIHAVIGHIASGLPVPARAVTAIIATVEGQRVLHVRRVHSR